MRRREGAGRRRRRRRGSRRRRSCARDRPRRIAPVGAEHDTAAPAELCVQACGECRIAAVVLERERRTAVARPGLEASAHERALHRVSAGQGDRRAGVCLRDPGGRRAWARSRTRRAARPPCATDTATGRGTSGRASRCRLLPRRRCSVSTTRPWIEAVWYPFSGSTHERATRGSCSRLRGFFRPSAELIRMLPSFAFTHTVDTWGEPSGLVVARAQNWGPSIALRILSGRSIAMAPPSGR